MNLKKIKKQASKLIKNEILLYYNKNLKLDEKLIFLESKNGGDIGGNIFYILKELSKNKYEDYKIVLSLKKHLFDCKKKILDEYGIKNLEFVNTYSLKYYKYLNSAKYLFNDATFPSIFMKKKGQIYTNVWHGTPLKKLGKFNIKRAYGLGNVQRNFLMADYLLYPNTYMEKKMIDSFMLNTLFDGYIINEGYPRNAILFDRDVEELKTELDLKNKKVIVYMPTWRGIYSNLDIDGQNKTIEKYLSEIDQKLSESQILYVKLHTIVEDNINYENYQNIRQFPKNKEVYDFLRSVDCLITDYSSIFFDFLCTGKKIILFVYDEKEYLNEIGTYFSLDKLPFPKVYNTDELIHEINKIKEYDDTEIIEKFCEYDNPNSAENLCENLILKQNPLKYDFKVKSKLKIKSIDSDKKENILIYGGNLGNTKITENLKKFLESIDLDKKNYILTFREFDVKNNSKTLQEISNYVDYIPMKDFLTLSFTDTIYFNLFFKYNIFTESIKKRVDKFYEFNINKYFGSIKFDYVLQFTGLNKQIINLFQRFKSKKGILIQKNIIREIKNKREHKLTLIEAYKNYDDVFIIDKDLIPLVYKISNLKDDKEKDNLFIIDNFNNLEKIINE